MFALFGILVICFFLYYNHKAVKDRRRKERAIRAFVDDALAKNEIYPVAGQGYGFSGHTGYVQGSAYRAADLLSIDSNEACGLIYMELDRRGLPLDEGLNPPYSPSRYRS